MFEDEVLKWKFKRGSNEALTRIYEKHLDSMLTLAVGLSNDASVAEDVVQDVFVSLVQSRHTLRVRGSLSGYLATSVVNRVRDHQRRRRRHAGKEPDLPVSDEPAGPDQAVILSEQAKLLTRADKDRRTSPQSLINCCLALEHHTWGQKRIDGVLCEGIEATAPGDLPFKSFSARLWVAVETGYPVLVEVEAIDNNDIRRTTTLDQFQWNVDLSAEDIEPEIPAGYEPL